MDDPTPLIVSLETSCPFVLYFPRQRGAPGFVSQVTSAVRPSRVCNNLSYIHIRNLLSLKTPPRRTTWSDLR